MGSAVAVGYEKFKWVISTGMTKSWDSHTSGFMKSSKPKHDQIHVEYISLLVCMELFIPLSPLPVIG